MTTVISEIIGLLFGIPYIIPEVKYKHAWKNAFQALMATAVMSLAILVISRLISNNGILTILLCIIGAGIYFAVLLLMKNEFVLSFLKPFMNKRLNKNI